MNSKQASDKSKKGRYAARAVIFVTAVLLIIFGIHSGEAAEVFQKAVRICLECIGVG